MAGVDRDFADTVQLDLSVLAVRVGDVDDDPPASAGTVGGVGEPEPQPESAGVVVAMRLDCQLGRARASEVAEKPFGPWTLRSYVPGFGSCVVSSSPAPIVYV